jgi:hypothetical protein
MPRREPFTQAEVYERRRVLGDAKPGALPSLQGDARPGELPSDAELDELAEAAGVLTAERGAFVQEVRAEIRLYRLNMLVSQQEEPSRKAEALKQVVTTGRIFQQALASLPDALRMEVEPEMIGLVHRYRLVRRSSGIVARKRYLPEQEEEPEDVSLPRVVARKRYLPGGWQMPGFDVPLADLINKAEAKGARQEARISGSRSRRQRTYYRDDLARALKALAVVRSPKFAKNERAAENWVAVTLDVLKISYPDPLARQVDFRRMFMPPGRRQKPQTPKSPAT